MSTLFGNLKEKTANMEAARDTVGGGSFVIDSDAYEMTLKAAFVGKAKSGANFMTVIFTREGEDREYREDLYFTSGDEKGNLPYYVKNDKQFPLPGYTIVSDLCLILGSAPLEETGFEEKVLNVYDYEQKKELPKTVMVPVELLGKKLIVGIKKVLDVKQEKDASGNYVDTDQTRETNNIDKLFDLDTKMTVLEAMNQATEATFYTTWVEANKGKIQDNTKRAKKSDKPGQAGAAGAPPKASGAAAAAPKKSLFGNK